MFSFRTKKKKSLKVFARCLGGLMKVTGAFATGRKASTLKMITVTLRSIATAESQLEVE
jgi:hypothetical protein